MIKSIGQILPVVLRMVWIDHGRIPFHINSNRQSTYVDKFVVVSLFQVMEYRGIIKVCQVRHILSLLVFWWIHLCELILLEILALLVWIPIVFFFVSQIGNFLMGFIGIEGGIDFCLIFFFFQFGNEEKKKKNISYLLQLDTYVDETIIITLFKIV